MCLTIPKEEAQTCFELTRPVWAAAILINDVQSWDKEYKLTQTQDKPDMTIMTNGIWVLMQQHSIDIEEAKRIIRQKVKGFVADILINLEEIKTRQDLSLDSRRLIEAMQYMHSGNLMWGFSCTRYYYPTRTLNDFQLNRMKNGWSGQIVQNHLHGS